MIKKYLAYVNSGSNLDSKLRLAIIVAFTNHITLGKVPGNIGQILIGVSNWLCKGVTVTVNGLLFNLVDYNSFYICSPNFEEWAWDYIKVQKGDLFIDVGAHLGKYTLPVAQAVGEKGLVIAVEASRVNYNRLKKNIEYNNLHNITLINAAAWNNDEVLKFYPGEISGGGGVKRKAGDKFNEVNGRSMDSLLEEVAGGVAVNWIKIDVEGAELEVLRGFKKTLCLNSPKLLVEVFKENEVEFEKYMRSLNYHYHTVSESVAVDLKYYYCWKDLSLKLAGEK